MKNLSSKMRIQFGRRKEHRNEGGNPNTKLSRSILIHPLSLKLFLAPYPLDSYASYTPTPIPATAHVYNPTPLDLKDNKLQQLKDA